jgi:RNA polymerase-interacting CarD/CdnL/TRCF family regulator
MFMGKKEAFVEQGDSLAGLPEPGESVFYPKVGHCVYRGLTEDKAAPGKTLVELEDLEEGSRILIPTERVPKLGLRPAGIAFDDIREELSSEFEQPLETEEELDPLIEELLTEGSPRNLAKGLKRLHLLRQTRGLSREEEQTRRKIRSWLAAEVALSKDCTRAEAQALITRILQEAMSAHRQKEKEEAKERRRQVKAQKAAEDAAKEEAAKEEAIQEEAVKEQAAQEQAAQEQAVPEEAPKEVAVQDQAPQEEAVQEQAPQEEAVKEVAIQEEAAKEETPQEVAIQEEAVKEETAKEDAAQEEAPQEAAKVATDKDEPPQNPS